MLEWMAVPFGSSNEATRENVRGGRAQRCGVLGEPEDFCEAGRCVFLFLGSPHCTLSSFWRHPLRQFPVDRVGKLDRLANHSW